MRRLFVLASLIVIIVAARPALAQPQPPAAKSIEFPVQVSNAAAGTVVEFFLNNGKLGDVVVDTSGTSGFILDMGNSGKTKLTLYVDVCKDGKIVKVIFTAGEPPPKDDDCNRKLVAAGFYNDCGITRVTIDVSKMLGKVVGCGGILNTKTLIAMGGGLVGVVALTTGGGGSTTTSTTSSQPPVTSTTTTAAAPPANNAPPAQAPSNPAPPSTPAPSDFSVTVTLSYEHVSSNQSVVCGVIVTNPPQPGGQFSVQVAGLGVITAQSTATGTLTSSGRGTFRVPILLLGTYNAAGTAAANSMTKPFNGSINVTQASNSCPSQ